MRIIVAPQSKAKQRSTKAKLKSGDSGSVINLSYEDDSHERKVVLAGPEKGAEACKLIKVSQSNPTYCLD